MSDRLLFIVPDGADSLLGILDQYMKGKAPSPYSIPPIIALTYSLFFDRMGGK